jgi:hypothetical protein
MKLTDLSPDWIDCGNRKGIGVVYDCIIGHCKCRIATLFANPLDGGAAYPDDEGRRYILELAEKEGREWHEYVGSGKCRWQRTGDDFATMSMSPSVNAYVHGHKTLTNGVFG